MTPNSVVDFLIKAITMIGPKTRLGIVKFFLPDVPNGTNHRVIDDTWNIERFNKLSLLAKDAEVFPDVEFASTTGQTIAASQG